MPAGDFATWSRLGARNGLQGLQKGGEFLTGEERSKLMGKIRGDDLSPETRVKSALRRLGERYRRNCERLPGRPDFVLDARRAVVFVHGCFWHGCPEHYRLAKTNREFWRRKVETNQARDRKCAGKLRRLGWSVYVVWEHDTKSPSRLDAVLTRKLAGQRRRQAPRRS